jgi:hypothetical protein
MPAPHRTHCWHVAGSFRRPHGGFAAEASGDQGAQEHQAFICCWGGEWEDYAGQAIVTDGTGDQGPVRRAPPFGGVGRR